MGYPPRGLILALVTPLDEEGRIDWPSLRRLTERALPFCDGLLIGEGLVGEGLSLPNRMRLELLQGSGETISGEKPLLLCPTASSTEETLSNIEAVDKTYSGWAGKKPLFWVDIPLWHHSNRKLPQLYQEWRKITSFPILLHNHPRLISKLNRSLKRNNIRTAILKRLSENEQIVGLIHAGDLKRTIHYQRAVRARRDFRFYDGDEKSFLNQPSSSGVVSWGANLLPAEWGETVRASLSLPEDPVRNLLLLKQSQKLRELNQILQMNPAKSLKFALHRLGVISRATLVDETPATPSGGNLEMENFLRENFSLQFTP
ncbi:MAG: dihydrodipicolinate synthase family protein [Deltaproteobacteria bacterium]|nr:dihydrodipicolinate synthase family protein [Deltaproteobacteria bacterium]